MSIDACVCLFVIWYYCSPGMCADVFPEESQFNWVYAAFVVGVHVVSATPLEDRTYVTCSYVFVFCHVSKSFFFVQFFQFIQFHSCRDFWWLRCEQAMSADAQPSSQSLLSGQKGRSSVPLVQRPPCSHLRVSGRGGRWHLGNIRLFIFFLVGKRLIKPKLYLSTQMGSMVDNPSTSSGNCPTDNANGLPSLRSRQKKFLRV